MHKTDIITSCHELLQAYRDGQLGDTTMPEGTHPTFNTNEERLTYFTLPMSLNYQRNSYTLRESALQIYQDPSTSMVFSIKSSSEMNTETLRTKLLMHKLCNPTNILILDRE